MERDISSADWDLVRRFVLALNRMRLGEALALTTPDIDLETPMIELWGLEQHGHDRLREWFRRIDREWAFVEWYGLELQDHGAGWVLGQMRSRGRGKASRAELDWPVYITARIEAGRIASFGAYLRRDSALEAAERARRHAAEG